jgi:hypothetical protein
LTDLIRAAHLVAKAKAEGLANCFDDNTPKKAKEICREIINLMDVVIALDKARDPDDPGAERLLERNSRT